LGAPGHWIIPVYTTPRGAARLNGDRSGLGHFPVAHLRAVGPRPGSKPEFAGAAVDITFAPKEKEKGPARKSWNENFEEEAWRVAAGRAIGSRGWR